MATTPADLLATAGRLGVDLATEPFLLPAIKQATTTPLPPQWTAVENDGKEAVYRNELTGEEQREHPADAYFLSQISTIRERNQSHDASSGWMEFQDPSGAKYYYDFVSGERQSSRPSVAAVVDTSRQQAPHAVNAKLFEHAASLHKSPSMKSLETLDILCFTSWWTESALAGSKKSYLQLFFSIPTRHFQLVLDDSEEVFTISHIVGPTGHVVSAWDLHVGARIQLLGRWTTLMQPSLLTKQWLDLHEKQFTTMKRELETELLKYELNSGLRRQPMTGSLACADPHKSKSGLSLRKLITEMEALKTCLAKYRPDVARRFVIPYELEE